MPLELQAHPPFSTSTSPHSSPAIDIFHLGDCPLQRAGGIWGLSKENDMTTRWQWHTQALLGNSLMVPSQEVPLSWSLSRGQKLGVALQTERCGKGPLGGGGIPYLGGVPQQPSGESLGQSNLKSQNHKALSYQWPSDAGYSFVDYERQGGPKWLKICLIRLFLHDWICTNLSLVPVGF